MSQSRQDSDVTARRPLSTATAIHRITCLWTVSAAAVTVQRPSYTDGDVIEAASNQPSSG